MDLDQEEVTLADPAPHLYRAASGGEEKDYLILEATEAEEVSGEAIDLHIKHAKHNS